MNQKILVVEDEIHIQRLVQMVLEKAGYQVMIAASGEEAIGLAEQHSDFILVLLDIMMPGIDGLQVLRTLKQSSKHQDLPVIMLTALAQEDVVIQGVKLGAKDYIRKPFHPADLIDRVQKILKAA